MNKITRTGFIVCAAVSVMLAATGCSIHKKNNDAMTKTESSIREEDEQRSKEFTEEKQPEKAGDVMKKADQDKDKSANTEGKNSSKKNEKQKKKDTDAKKENGSI